MPMKPPTPCRTCRRATKNSNGYCDKHQASANWQKVDNTKSGRGGRPWRRKRKRIFERDNFLCQIHLAEGKLVPVDLHGANAGVCDHIKPLSDGGSDSEGNLQTICQECNKNKTLSEALRGRGG